MSTKYGGDSPEEIQAQIASAEFNLHEAKLAETNLKKLHTAMTRIGVVDSKARRLELVKSAIRYTKSTIEPSCPKQLTASIRLINNELTSLDEGIRANSVPQEEMYLISGLEAAKKATALVAAIETKIARLRSGMVTAGPDVPPSVILQRNAKFKAKMPDLTGKDYGVARVPVAFAMLPDSGHTSVGYLDPNQLQSLGFKAELLDGYAIISGQVVLGISRDALVDWEDVTLEDGTVTKEAVPKIVKDRVTKFVKDKPGIGVRKRNKTALDAAKEVKTLLERHTNTKYAFVSERSHGYKGDSYFWIMPAMDMRNFARAFPGGHIRLHSWGFAF